MNEHCYLVSYDLCQPGRDYSSLYNAIRGYSQWGKLTESTWAIVSANNAVQIFEHLRNFIDSNDRLIVILSGKSAAWNQVWANDEWVKTNLVK